MEREIIFRGKQIDNGEWVEGDLLRQRNALGYGSAIVYFEDEYILPRHPSVDLETVGQYTGMKDKNGKRIFEGDVLRKQGCSDVYIVFDKKTASFGWTFTDFIRSQGYIHKLNKYYTSLSEIIGNIHDNPELLEVQG